MPINIVFVVFLICKNRVKTGKFLNKTFSTLQITVKTRFFAQQPLTALKTNNHKTDHVSLPQSVWPRKKSFFPDASYRKISKVSITHPTKLN